MPYDKELFAPEEIPTNPHPVATGIAMSISVMGAIAFLFLAIAAAGCSSPPDNCSEVDKCDNGDDVDGSTPDQPDASTNCATNGTCPDAASATDAPSVTSCATLAWMENPEMFDCDRATPDNQWEPLNSCNPILIEDPSGCQIKCEPMFWAIPDQVVMHEPERYFDYTNVESEVRLRCHQRL